MCGIVGYVGQGTALDFILAGLEKLEYRGYDSAGIAIHNGIEVVVTRAEGKLNALKDTLANSARSHAGSLGIGHTRWATHGRPSENNAHPHTAGRVSLIHNGIIENYVELRQQLEAKGRTFLSETDSEIAAHLLDSFITAGYEPFEALQRTCREIRGSYAFLAIVVDHSDRILVAKNSTPIVIGLGEGEMYVASDIPAILAKTRRVIILEDGDLAEVTAKGVRIEHDGNPVERPIEQIAWDPITAQKGGFKHYMLKEIHEQGQATAETVRGRISLERPAVTLPELHLTNEYAQTIDRIVLLACGTAWHSCLVGKFYLELLAGVPCEVDYASEFRYRNALIDSRTLVVVVSQSGETADTLAALSIASGRAVTVAVCNVVGSSIARKVDHVLYTHAGPEISVASTKAFTTQLSALYLLALDLGVRRGKLNSEQLREHLAQLVQLPGAIDETVKLAEQVEQVARKYYQARDFLFLGRGLCYPIALEGALKLKEISYIHAEGYPAGEMKHGPIALIDDKLPVVVVLQRSERLFDKTLGNLREVESRAGRIIAITDYPQQAELHRLTDDVIELPYLSQCLSPILLTIPLQLLAYYVAVLNGTDVDLPRNLAKSVTVE